MANVGAKVTISAVDRVSSIVDRINGRLDRMRSPVERLRSSFGRLGRLSGFTSLNNGMKRIARSALGAFRTMGQIVPVLGTITGAASVAGIYRLSSAWAQFGTQLRTASRAMGMAPQRLQAMRNAAQLAGGSGDSMADALQQLSTTRWEAANGFAPEAAAQFQALGISLKELQTIAPDKMFERIASKIRAIHDPAARTIAAMQIFGGAAQGLLPILQQSEREYQANVRMAERYGVMNQRGADAAARMQRSMTGLSLAAQGFGFSLAEAVEPAIRPVLDGMSEWIAANRQWIAQDIAGYVGRFMSWLRNGGWQEIKDNVHAAYLEVSNVVDKLGGWENAGRAALGAIAGLYALPVLAGLLQVVAAITSIGTALTGIGTAAGVAGIAMRTGLGFAAWEVLHPSYTSAHDTLSPELRRSLGQDLTKNDRLFGVYARSVASIEHARYNQMGGARGAYAGRYQMGRGAISDAARWLHEGVPSQARFLSDPAMQERYFRAYTASNQATLSANSSAFRRMDAEGKGEILAYAHNQGAGGALSFLQTGQVGSDANGTPGTAYSDLFARNVTSAPAAIVPSGNINGPAPALAPQGLKVEVIHENAPPGSKVRVTSASPGLRVSSVTQSRAMAPELSGGGL